MIFLICLSLFFCWLIICSIKSPLPFDRYDFFAVIVYFSLALLCAKLPYEHWKFERFLTVNAIIIAENPKAKVHCNSVFDSMYDSDLFRIGHASPETGEIVFQHSWCKTLKEYLLSPENPSKRELMSLHLFTHEAMHARGEYNEQKTDCQAIQRDYRAAKLLGVPSEIAKRNAMTFYKTQYMNHPYFSRKCAPGKALDERLKDSTWHPLRLEK